MAFADELRPIQGQELCAVREPSLQMTPAALDRAGSDAKPEIFGAMVFPMTNLRFYRPLLALALSAIGLLPIAPVTAQEFNVRFQMCGRDRVTCVVDGDTIWLQGVNLRLESFDTPEPHNDICGGQAEVALAKRASARLLKLLNGNPFTVQTHGSDRYGRTLATIRIAGTDVGDILIAEGLARKWPNGREFWC